MLRCLLMVPESRDARAGSILSQEMIKFKVNSPPPACLTTLGSTHAGHEARLPVLLLVGAQAAAHRWENFYTQAHSFYLSTKVRW
jgi:hypothetical protein